MVQGLDSATEGLDNITDVGDLRQLVIQLVDGGENRAGAGDLGVCISDDIPGTVVAVLDGELHLFF